MIKITTTFWSPQVFEFDHLLLIKYSADPYNQIPTEIDRADLSAKGSLSGLFKRASKLAVSKQQMLSTRTHGESGHIQFGVILDDEITPVKWFNIVTEKGDIYSHDVLREVTLLRKNGHSLPFGQPYYDCNRPYRANNIKRQVFKFVSNQLKNL